MPRSLSARLSIWIVLASALLFLGLIFYLGRVYNVGVNKEVDKDAVQVLDNAVLRLDDILDDVERSTHILAWTVSRDLARPDEMITYSNATVRYNDPITSCSISFEPWYYKSKGEFYSICTWRTRSGEVLWEQEGDESYVYYEKNWYLRTKQLGTSCWTEPYTDLYGDEVRDSEAEIIVSFCEPLYERDSVFVGSVSLDLSIRRLSAELNDVQPYANAFCVLVGDNGTYLVHKDPSKLYYHSFFSDAEEMDLPELEELGRAMDLQQEGKRVIRIDGEKYLIYFQPIPTTGWSMALFCPESDIFAGYLALQRSLLIALIIALLAMFFLFVFLIRHQLNPLGRLAKEADFIASGDFTHPLPPVKRKDEIGLLNRSFKNMQQSLVAYIQEVTQAAASRERMKKELQIARSIQMGMVPHEFDLGDEVDLYASMAPAREVGGDLYDFFIQNGKLYFCIGDVSGKGVPASLIMSVCRSMFRIVARQNLSPAEIASRINDTLAEKNDQMLFVTMFIACVDLKTDVMEYCNCGHNAPVLLSGSGQKPAFIDCKPNTAVGILPGFAFEGQRIEDFSDKVLFLYTDGLNEAENEAHEQFGNDRMLEELGREAFRDSRTLVDRLSQAVADHVAGAEASDDLTMLCLKITPDCRA